jgi:hypothetical protein
MTRDAVMLTCFPAADRPAKGCYPCVGVLTRLGRHIPVCQTPDRPKFHAKSEPEAMHRIITLLFGLAFLFAAPDGRAEAAGRVALVIGNSAYEHVSPLKNPKNDAEAISAMLAQLGFKVIKGIDLTRAELEAKAREFALSSRGSEVALFYYAGHGLQVNGQNYLAPVDVELADEADLDFQTVSLDTILRNMERERRTNLVFLDACRDNPLARNLARSMGTRSTAVGRGLARTESGIGTLIAFATQPGNVALDGDGSNSPFTTALLQHIETPDLDVALLMRRVREDVMAATNDRQVPWSNSSLTGSFAFAGTAAGAAPSATSQPAANPAAQAWNTIKDTNSRAVLEAFLKEYPEGIYATFAKARLQELGSGNKIAALPKLAPEPAAPAVRHAERPRVNDENCSRNGDTLYCASSVLSPQGKNAYRTVNLSDGRASTAWVEGQSGHGVGEWILIEFNRERVVHGLDLRNGYAKSRDIFTKNSRVRELEIRLSTGQTMHRTLKDTDEPQTVSLDGAGVARWLQLRILSVYPGSKYRDTAISELRVDAD